MKSYDHVASARLASAVRANNAKAAAEALAAGANPNLRGPANALNQASLVDAAVECGAHYALAVLLRAGALVRAPKNKAMTVPPPGTAIHAAARNLDDAVFLVFERYRKAGPLAPLDENGMPPLAHALRVPAAPFQPGIPEAPLVARWLDAPLALREKSPGRATLAILGAAMSTRPPEFLDRLMAAGLDPLVCGDGSALFAKAAEIWRISGSPGPTGAPVREWLEGWTSALARLGLPWQEEAGSRDSPTLRACHAAGWLERSLPATAQPPRHVRPRL